MSEAKPIDWKAVHEKLPIEKTEEEKKVRAELFSAFDPNGNGYLSLAEVDKGLATIGLGDLLAKPVILRAFNKAKGVNNAKQGKDDIGRDYVERVEFRLLLLYLRQYLEVWELFAQIKGDDRKVEFVEFTSALPKLEEKWGLKIDDPKKEFDLIDANGGGSILFDEFAHWALNKNLDLEENHL